ncbi:chloramphenicol acetyltransferase [Dyadobacter psychrotolerans]|uniref:Chloramphenicol acetyltransferase n=1 Tax=Dyadobacter psychrotolerans TaxID=2541721 RepID=A0A4V2Z3Z9_9BACT|nr:chloramphenicol acetyltransferase [Dyadobacter psychrotolerans]TDE14648.1 chloramphenicol acetyltransferase [Dyadobacter psychrotolerans]
MTILDLENWERKEHFRFFSQFEEPFFGVCVEVDCTIAYQKAKQLGTSFFIYYLHKTLVAVNETEPFRYRINEDNDIVIYDKISVSATVGRPNGTFGFSYMPYDEDYQNFEATARLETERIIKSSGLFPSANSEDVIHCSSLPWIKFTSMSHARRFSSKDSCPKISYGKMTESSGKKLMPVSIHVHHALMDGLHVGMFVEKFQSLLDS